MGLPITVDATSTTSNGRNREPRIGVTAVCAAAETWPMAPREERRLERGASPNARPGRIPAAAIHRSAGRSAERRTVRAIMIRKPAGMMSARIHEGMAPTLAVGSKPRSEKERLESARTVRKRTSTNDVQILTQVFARSPSASNPKLKARWRLSREVIAPPVNAIHRTR